MKFDFDVRGLDNLQASFKEARNIVMDENEVAMDKVMAIMTGRTKELTPVLTGNLRRSVHPEGPFTQGDTVKGIVGTDVYYAPFVEFDGVKRMYMGKFMFTQAFEYTKTRIKDLFQDAVSRMVGRLSF